MAAGAVAEPASIGASLRESRAGEERWGREGARGARGWQRWKRSRSSSAVEGMSESGIQESSVEGS